MQVRIPLTVPRPPYFPGGGSWTWLTLTSRSRAITRWHWGTAGLYGRDDVFQALKVQAQVLASLRKGWAPMSAQRRGAEQPLEEPVLDRSLAPLH